MQTWLQLDLWWQAEPACSGACFWLLMQRHSLLNCIRLRMRCKVRQTNHHSVLWKWLQSSMRGSMKLASPPALSSMVDSLKDLDSVSGSCCTRHTSLSQSLVTNLTLTVTKDSDCGVHRTPVGGWEIASKPPPIYVVDPSRSLTNGVLHSWSFSLAGLSPECRLLCVCPFVWNKLPNDRTIVFSSV